jgi:hypothetical protein
MARPNIGDLCLRRKHGWGRLLASAPLRGIQPLSDLPESY